MLFSFAKGGIASRYLVYWVEIGHNVVTIAYLTYTNQREHTLRKVKNLPSASSQ